jgi:hypothetical protein
LGPLGDPVQSLLVGAVEAVLEAQVESVSAQKQLDFP